MTRSHCQLQSTGDQEEKLTLRATILWWTASLPMPAQNTMPLPIRTAALLGTPSKTLRSGTPELFGAQGNSVSPSVLARTQKLTWILFTRLLPRWRSYHRVDWWKCQTGIRKHWKYRARTLGYDAVILVPRHPLHWRWLPERQLRKLLQELMDKINLPRESKGFMNS